MSTLWRCFGVGVLVALSGATLCAQDRMLNERFDRGYLTYLKNVTIGSLRRIARSRRRIDQADYTGLPTQQWQLIPVRYQL